ncbi:hypothetical protein SpCBS45565_g03636 [Spizellomyces sp. 'palustris']|nr:hypothetical protein SpCBS45565_g03636 [Spizellomyces sp. 'palustris']
MSLLQSEAHGPGFKVYQLTETHDSHTLCFQFTVMESSVFAWVGTPGSGVDEGITTATGRLDGLAVAMPTRFDKTATSTSLLPTFADDVSERIARRLATKLGIQVFISFNVPTTNEELALIAERRLAVLINETLAKAVSNQPEDEPIPVR